MDHHEQNIRYLGQSHRRRCLRQPGFPGVRSVECVEQIMQIVTSAVRIDVALTLSRRRSLFAPPNLRGTLVVLAHADAQSLCAAGACSLSEPWWLDQFTAQRQGTTAFSGLMCLRFSSCATSLIVTREAAIAQLGVCQTEDLKVSSSAPALHGAPVGAAPDFQSAHCPCNLSGSGVNFVVDDFTVHVFLGLNCLRSQTASPLRRSMGCSRS